MMPCGDFYKTVTQDFAKSGINCDANIRKSWKAVNNVSSSGKLLSEISKHPFSSTQLRVVGVLEPFPAVIGSEVWLHPEPNYSVAGLSQREMAICTPTHTYNQFRITS